MLKQLIVQLYGASGFLVAPFYLPQLRSIWTDAGGARGVSLLFDWVSENRDLFAQ